MNINTNALISITSIFVYCKIWPLISYCGYSVCMHGVYMIEWGMTLMKIINEFYIIINLFKYSHFCAFAKANMIIQSYHIIEIKFNYIEILLLFNIIILTFLKTFTYTYLLETSHNRTFQTFQFSINCFPLLFPKCFHLLR